MSNKPVYYAIDQNGKQLFIGDTVLRHAKNDEQFDDSPPNLKFYVITDIQPNYEPQGGHHYRRKNMPEGGVCTYISINDYGNGWAARSFTFSCRHDA